MKRTIKELESIRNEIQQAAGEVVETYDKISLWWIRGKTPQDKEKNLLFILDMLEEDARRLQEMQQKVRHKLQQGGNTHEGT